MGDKDMRAMNYQLCIPTDNDEVVYCITSKITNVVWLDDLFDEAAMRAPSLKLKITNRLREDNGSFEAFFNQLTPCYIDYDNALPSLIIEELKLAFQGKSESWTFTAIQIEGHHARFEFVSLNLYQLHKSKSREEQQTLPPYNIWFYCDSKELERYRAKVIVPAVSGRKKERYSLSFYKDSIGVDEYFPGTKHNVQRRLMFSESETEKYVTIVDVIEYSC